MKNNKRYKNILITGGAGFVAPYLYEQLVKSGYHVYISKLEQEIGQVDLPYLRLDILNINDIKKVIKKYHIDAIFHLAAISNVPFSWQHPNETFNVNVNGTINVLEAIKDIDQKIRLLLVGSGEIYGKKEKSAMPLKENETCNPVNFYAMSKYVAEKVASLYHEAYGLDVIYIRAFNHVGPRQSTAFVLSDFANQIAKIEKGEQAPTIYVGNLASYRDFSDVRDVVKAYTLLLENGQTNEVYNVGSGSPYQIQFLLNELLKRSTKKIEIAVDEKRFRPIDVEYYYASIDKLVAATNFKKEYTIEDTLDNLLMYARSNV